MPGEPSLPQHIDFKSLTDMAAQALGLMNSQACALRELKASLETKIQEHTAQREPGLSCTTQPGGDLSRGQTDRSHDSQECLDMNACRVSDPSPLGGHILLVEDHPINQEVTRAMLEFLGCRVGIVENGRDALQAVESVSYDLVLMDCQMPEMDGLEATRQIRQWESSHKASRRNGPIPIVALTVHAQNADRIRCLNAGMDAHVAKPFSQNELRSVLEQWLPKNYQSNGKYYDAPDTSKFSNDGVTISSNTSVDCGPLDRKTLANIEALQQTGRPDLLAKIINSYLNSTPSIVESLQHAITSANAAALHHAAHSLKSSSAAVGAFSFSALCQELETIGRSQQMEHAEPLLDKISADYAAVYKALKDHLLKRQPVTRSANP